MDYKYNNLYKKYNLDDGVVAHIGTGVVKVHDIFDATPDFMKDADIIICDPPYNKSALSAFYTKAEKQKRADSFDVFLRRFFDVVREISPRLVCLEVGVPMLDSFMVFLSKMYSNIITKESYYYKNKSNKCLFVFASNEPIDDAIVNMPFMDEEDVIRHICQNIDFSCVADPCMGMGLVAYYANKAGKRFVGTELNKYRLAVCCERVTTGERGKYN